MMQPADFLTLQAFLKALTQLEEPLTADLQAKLNQVAITWAQDESTAIKQLRQVTQQSPRLQSYYDASLDSLRASYQAESRNKFLLLPGLATPSDQPQTSTHEFSTLDLEKAFHQILSAPDSISAAKRMGRVITVYERAVEVLENRASAWSWLNRENPALGEVVPLDLLETEAGAEQVNTLLGRIEYGVYS